MSQHLVALHAIEQERIAAIQRFTEALEATVDRAVEARLAELVIAEELRTPRTSPQPVKPLLAREPSRPARAMPILPAMPSRTPTAIPANITITRLPPGPSPHDRRRSAPSMDCRLPGCLMRSRGPRYEYFCDDHFRQLTPDERRHWAEVWRANRAPRPSSPS